MGSGIPYHVIADCSTNATLFLNGVLGDDEGIAIFKAMADDICACYKVIWGYHVPLSSVENYQSDSEAIFFQH